MEKIQLLPLCEEDIKTFKKDMQEAFQKGAEEGFADIGEEILPESHIDRSLQTAGAVAYKAVLDGEIVGGVIVVIDEETRRNHLDFLYVRNGVQSKGVGQAIWQGIEKLHPETEVWETHTPYFEKRNIHFYVNRCGFHIVEFYNKYHADPNYPEATENLPNIEYFEGMFRFEKVMGE